MEIILLKQIKSLGNPGDIKDVRRGYAINFLIPNDFALPATPGFIKEAQSRIRKLTKAQKAEIEEMKGLIDKIKGLELEFAKKASKEGKLFGSINKKDIIKAIADKIGKEIDERYIALEKSIKEIGEHNVEIKVNEELGTKVKVSVKEEGGKKSKK